MSSAADPHRGNQALLSPLRTALYDYDPTGVQAALRALFAPDAAVRLTHPFEDLDGPDGLYDEALAPLVAAWPDLERRDYICIAGSDPGGHQWVGCAGSYMGTFAAPWFGIPATGRPIAMRYHEFFRFSDQRVVEMQAVWDVPEVMMAAGVWPMTPSLGRDWLVPSPATGDGLRSGMRDVAESQASVDHVIGMLSDMGRHPREPVEVMRLEHWWHPRFSWYGPHGIGTGRGVDGFRRFHQIPFLRALPDRQGGYAGDGHFFGDGAYVGVTGWPGMAMTVTGDGWLGIAASGQEITMRSLDFWRIESQVLADSSVDRKIRENWVLVDLLHVYDQLGVDVLARMSELAAK
ncbi:MAG: ester cyclase [Acidimicrobiales bacterium]|nr:ester cyclase [Acidimicrobiales bacterium]MYJ48648.1 ester cyclase [Acidimicrobiales bacterium]